MLNSSSKILELEYLTNFVSIDPIGIPASDKICWSKNIWNDL